MSELRFKLESVESDGRALLTSCLLSVYLDENAVWPVRGIGATVEIQIDDLLSHLVQYWKPLLLRQTYPLDLNPTCPSDLEAEARKRWDELPGEQVTEEDDILERFQRAHDLSKAFAGLYDLPALWLLRTGDEMWIDAAGGADRVSLPDAVRGLEQLGNEIAHRLGSVAGEKWSRLLLAWNERDVGDGLALLAWTTGLNKVVVKDLAEQGLLALPTSVCEAANDNDELRIAARMASALPGDQVEWIVRRVSAFLATDCTRLDELSNLATDLLSTELANAKPFEQGNQLATAMRGWLSISESKKLDIFALTRELDLTVVFEQVGNPNLDALVVWGKSHGPAVLLNIGSERHESWKDRGEESGQIRATTAHELCHLLADRGHGVTAVEVLNNKMPSFREQRARAFAAEFLLPKSVAGERWQQAGRPFEVSRLDGVLSDLCSSFAVSKSLASWQLQHGAGTDWYQLGLLLRSIVPAR